jgi:hypothetical protein
VRGTRTLGWAIAGCSAFCLAAVLLAAAFQAPRVRVSTAKPRVRASVSAAVARPRYEQLPLAFEPAGGESDGDAKFVARGNGYALFLTPSEAVLALGGKHSKGSAALRLKMVGANAMPSFAASDELPGKSNYFIGNSPAKWRTNVPNYRKVTERGVYDGVDVVYYGNQRRLEYDFAVSPGANPNVIQIAFQGAESLRIDPAGDLVISVTGGDVRMHKPIAYQGTGPARREVVSGYVMKSAHSVSLQIARYDTGQQLIIDPVLSYSTYLGGSNIDGGNAIAVAPDNTAFVAGSTFSTDFPTAHPLQANAGGGSDFPKDAFVAKISADGSTLLYSTYLGGENEDVANGIAVDAAGEAFVTGNTNSPHFPTTFGALNTECGGDGRCGASYNPPGFLVSNAFVTKLNRAGSGIIYSGLIGEYEHVLGLAIAVDADDLAYVTGQVGANIPPTVPTLDPPPPFPITAQALQPIYGGGTTDAFVAKISADGATLEYSSYLGGNDEDVGYGIATDNAGNAYVAGLTYSANFPVSGGAAQSAYGGAADAFISEVNTPVSAPGTLIYSTYLGGSGLDQANGVALDANGNIYVAGGTSSSGLFASAPGLQKTNNGEGDAFAAKINPAVSGTAGIVYFTYLGGSKADSASGIALDGLGDAYLTGSTVSSSDFPIGPAAFQPTYGGGNADSFVTELNPAGTTLIYSSYLGGTNTEIGGGIAVDSSGSAYVTGQTCSQDFPVTNPLQATPGGNCDAYISKVTIQNGIAVNPAGLVFSAQSLGTTSPVQTLTITNGDAKVTIKSIVVSGPQLGDFADPGAASCTAAMLPGAQCAFNVTFTPTAGGIRKALITITVVDTLGNPLPSPVLNLTGSTSTVTLSSSSLNFVTQAVGTTTSQQVKVTNTGSDVLTFSSITASDDFSETNNCGVALQPLTNCVINVSYTPSTVGMTTGALTLTDNGTGSPQIVLLTGTGFQQNPDFTLSASQASATVSAGQTAVYTLTISPVGGFSQPVTLSCGGLPREAACSASSNPVTVGGTTQSVVTVVVDTAVRTLVPPLVRRFDLPGGAPEPVRVLFASLLVFLSLVVLAGSRRRPARAVFGLAAVLLLLATACGNGSQSGVPAGTPAGTSQFTVTGTSGALTHTMTFTLTVN